MPDTRKIALIIGVDRYYHTGLDGKSSLAPLPSCKNDAMDLYNLLSSEKFGYKIYENSPIIGSTLDINNSFRDIQTAIIQFFKTADIGHTLLFYFSGHGVTRQDDEVFLATPEVDPNEPMIGGFRLSDLTRLVNSSRARRIVCIIDSCYSGAANLYDLSLVGKSTEERDEETAKSAHSTSSKILENLLKDEGRYFLLSTQSYERSYAPRKNAENSDINSIFTKYLLEGLQGVKPTIDEKGKIIPYTGSIDGNGYVTPETLYRYVSYKVTSQISRQVPVLKGTLSSGDMIILAEHPWLAQTRLPGWKLYAKPLYFIWIIDCSRSMEQHGKIHSLNHAIREAIPYMQRMAEENPHVDILVRVLKVSKGAQWLTSGPVPISEFKWVDLMPESGRDMGKALSMVADILQIPPMTNHGIPPVLVLISDGQPTDDYYSGLKYFYEQPWVRKAVRIAIPIGDDADLDALQKFIGNSEIEPLQAYNVQLGRYIKFASTDVGNSSIHSPVDESTSTVLRDGQTVKVRSLDITCQVGECLGSGAQGEVYTLNCKNDVLALKWYFPSAATGLQQQLLQKLIEIRAPTDKFLWPSEMVLLDGVKGFGCIMPFKENRYKSISLWMRRRVDPSFRALITACIELSSFHLLHSKGLCYRDISLNNIYFDPYNGDILIGDCDNIVASGKNLGSILGTPKFMAPEIVRGEALPNIQTDLFSLSVLLFYILFLSHPLEGKKEIALKVLDMPAMIKLYGTEPIFIFDPVDHSNEPDPRFHNNAIIFWTIYPKFLRDLFTKAFTDGLHDPENGRISGSEWQMTLIKLRNLIFYCGKCSAENFYDPEREKDISTGASYPSCHKCKNQLAGTMK